MIDSDTLVREFVRITLERDKMLQKPEAANKLYFQRHEIFKTLRQSNDLDKLAPLLDHENNSVVMATCLYYLLVDDQLTIRKLKELSKQEGIKGFAAENLISQWQNGEISYDY